jgi:hypothetical protein
MSKTNYKPKTLKSPKQRNKIHPIAVELTQLFANALMSNPPLPNTAWCIDLARMAIGWELAAHGQKSNEDTIDINVMNKIIAKVEKDKGVKIRVY